MSEAFYIPVATLEERGLSFSPQCLSCGARSEETVALRGGQRSPGGGVSMEYEQPVPLCELCQRLQRETERLNGRLAAAKLAFVGLVAVVVVALARALGWIEALPGTALALGAALLGGWIAASLLAAPLRAWATARRQVEGRPLSSFQAVELFYFRDPRLGEDARFLCLRIDNAEQAQAFAARNPFALDSVAFEASYREASSTPG